MNEKNQDQKILKLKFNTDTKDDSKNNIDNLKPSSNASEKIVDMPQSKENAPIKFQGIPNIISVGKTQIITPIQKNKTFRKKTFIPRPFNENKFATKPENKPNTPNFNTNRKPYVKNPNHNTNNINQFKTKKPPFLSRPPISNPFSMFPLGNSSNPFEKKDIDKRKKNFVVKKESNKPKNTKFSNIVGNNFIGKIEYSSLEDHEYYKIKKGKRNQFSNKNKNILKKTIELSDPISLKELANQLSTKLEDIIAQAKYIGYEGELDNQVDIEILDMIATSLGHSVIRKDNINKEKFEIFNIKIDQDTAKKRAPIVAIVGHVDHGKTSLLDKIKKSNIAKGEFGEITQRIGAYSVETKEGNLTFIDTPGHAAFTNMRKMGLKINDITILVISATEGIKDQTVEAIKQIKQSKSEFLIAATKCDLPNANIDKIKQDLMQYEIIVKDYGGETEIIEVSSITGHNINLLLQTILTYAELLNLQANEKVKAVGHVLESKIDTKAGILVSLIVKQGTLKVGDIIATTGTFGKIKGMWDDNRKVTKQAFPSIAVEVLGFNDCPTPGDIFAVVENHEQALELTKKSKIEEHKEGVIPDLFAEEKPTLYLVINAETQGTLEALEQNLQTLNTTHSQYKIIKRSIGKIKESDLEVAKLSNAIVILYGLNPDKTVQHQAQTDHIRIVSNKIIYHINEQIQEELDKLIVLVEEEIYLGTASIQRIFKSSKVGHIAGCLVNDGKIMKGCVAKVFRKDNEIFKGKIDTLKRNKDDVKEVKNSLECGIFVNYKEIEIGDEIRCYKIEYKKPDEI